MNIVLILVGHQHQNYQLRRKLQLHCTWIHSGIAFHFKVAYIDSNIPVLDHSKENSLFLMEQYKTNNYGTFKQLLDAKIIMDTNEKMVIFICGHLW